MIIRSEYASGLEGRKVGDQTVISRAPNRGGAIYWIVKCACGVERPVSAIALFKRGVQTRCAKCAAMLQTGPESRMWRGGRIVPLTHFNKFVIQARRRKKEWRLTISDLDDLFDRQSGRCVFTGDRLFFDHGARNGVERGNASLDRITSSGIYEIGNVQLVTKDVNMAKQCLSNADFVAMCRRVAEWSSSE